MTDDREILDALREEGREDYAFNLLVRKYSERLYWHIRRAVIDHDDTDDLLQNTFIKAWKYLPGFREDSRLYTWLYRIATNETINYLRSKRLRTMLPFNGQERAACLRLTEEQGFTGDEITRRLYRAIAQLPPRQKMIFTMRYFNELKFTEIAAIVNRTVGAVKASYHQAHTKLRQILDTED